MSLGVYVTHRYQARERAGRRGAFKVLRARALSSSAFFLYGIALAYAATGDDQARRHRLAVAHVVQPDLCW
jgi:NADH:ubiquinone oxidoreductase subunit 2 (subunit N)